MGGANCDPLRTWQSSRIKGVAARIESSLRVSRNPSGVRRRASEISELKIRMSFPPGSEGEIGRYAESLK